MLRPFRLLLTARPSRLACRYESLKEEHIIELVRINTAPLPSAMLQRPGGDDTAVQASSTADRASRAIIAPCLTCARADPTAEAPMGLSSEDAT